MAPVIYQSISKWDEKKRPYIYPATVETENNDHIIVEVGPGRGDFLFHLAMQNPQALVIGIEIKAKRIDKLIDRSQKRGIKNLQLIEADARHILKSSLLKSKTEAIHINFPDPWPKKRHAKHRVMNKNFIQNCIDALEDNGHLYFTTDVEWYAHDVATAIKVYSQLIPCFEPCVSESSPEAFASFFYEKWTRLGRKTYYQKYQKKINI